MPKIGDLFNGDPGGSLLPLFETDETRALREQQQRRRDEAKDKLTQVDKRLIALQKELNDLQAEEIREKDSLINKFRQWFIDGISAIGLHPGHRILTGLDAPTLKGKALMASNLSHLRRKSKLSDHTIAEKLWGPDGDHKAVAKHCKGTRCPEDRTLSEYATLYSRELGITITVEDLKNKDLSVAIP